MAARRCRTAKGRFTRCSTKGAAKRKTTKRKSTKGTHRKGRCVKWAKGRKRCLKRAK